MTKSLIKFTAFYAFGIFLAYSEMVSADSLGGKTIELTISHNQTNIAGTLALPEEALTNSLVIMLSGSGPQDRDETLDGFRVFFHLAKHLSDEGIPNFRFDDRGVGRSTGNFGQSTLTDHANDVIKIMDYFANHDANRFERFILLGHSQGGIVSAHVAATHDGVEKVILMAAPAVPLIDLVLSQLRQEYSQQPIEKALIERGVSAHNRLIWAIKRNEALDQELAHFEETMLALLTASSEAHTEPLSDLKKQAAQQAHEFEIVYALPSLTSFLYHDPAEDLKQLAVPVLG